MFQRIQCGLFALDSFASEFLAGAALHQRVEIFFHLFGQSEEVIAAYAQMLIVEPSSGFKDSVVLREPGSFHENGFQKEST
jgi:hypothetical protein